MAGYNLTRSVDELLETNRTAPPSFTVHLYPEHWTLNSGLKFLYNNQVASLLDDIRAQRIPNDFLELFDSARVPFYDGHMIVELLDYRPPKGKDPILENPEKRRVVLSPNAETMWTDLCLLNQKAGNVWTDQDALEVEAQILMSTAPPLCLDPDPHLTRMVNGVLRVTVPPAPPALKRKAAAMEMEEDEMDRARRAKIMQYMNPKPHRSSAPSYRILDVIQRMKMQKAQQPPGPTPMPAPAASPAPIPTPTPVPVPMATAPVPTSLPMQYAVNVPIVAARASATPAPTPTPPPHRPSSGASDAKRSAKPEPGRSPLMRPPSTIPPALPPHMQTHYQMGRSTPAPPQTANTPRPPSVAPSVGSPVVSENRPPSAAKMRQSPQVMQPAQQPPQRAQPSPAQPPPQQQPVPQVQAQPPTSSTFQPQLPAANFLTQPPGGAKKKISPQTSAQAQYIAAQYQAYQNRMNHHQNPNAAPAPMNAAQAQAVQRNNAMVAARSPIPQQQNGQQMPHPQQQQYNYAVNQYNAQFRAQHPQLMQHHLANGAANAAAAATAGQNGQMTQDQQAHPAAPMVAPYPAHMFNVNYQQMGMNMGAMPQARMPQGYWPVSMGRGVPIANGQHQMPGMAGHPQQLGTAGKASGMQGS